MMCFFLLPYFTFHLFLLFIHFPSYTHSLCNHHDSSAMLQFKNSFVLHTSAKSSHCSSFSSKIDSWKNGTDCCKWDGVTCDIMSGHVIGLDLSCSHLKGKFYPNSTIFHLRHLQQLNLAFNDFSGSSIHSGIGDLENLTHLNLSNSEINGDVPSAISHLSKLVSLSLSNDWINDPSYWRTRLDPFTWKKLILNATNLRELHLDSVDMSSIRESSLSLLMNLSSSLVSLSLTDTGLQGNFPSDILSLPNLQELNLSFNQDLSGQLPKYNNLSTPLRYLDLSFTAFSGEIPNSIGHLKSLNRLSLTECKFYGLIPLSFWNLTQLTYLSLSNNNFNGEIPSLISNLRHLTSCDFQFNNFSGHIPDVFGKLMKLENLSLNNNNLGGQVPSSLFLLTKLSHLDLSFNKLVGSIPIEINKHSKLNTMSLDNNMLNGSIPHWCYSLPSLKELYLNGNHLTGPMSEFSNSLQSLCLSNNKLQGNFPNSIFEFENLIDLSLSSTNLSGVVDFHQFSKFKNLFFIDLSHNSLLTINTDSSDDYIIPSLETLFLSSSNFNSFPKFLARLQKLKILDLSHNNIHGKIPNWFHEKLLHSWKDIQHIDLSFNKLQGDLPIPPYGIQYFLVSNNNFTGDISSTLCNASSLTILNLARNKLTGMIPQCLGTFPSLSVLDLQMNSLYGSMPGSFSKGNALETIKLNGNQLEGPLPRSLARCTKLEVLDLGDNIIGDTFPSWLETLQELQVLSLRSNKLDGEINCFSMKHPFAKLRIFDVSNNNFSGPLPTSCIKNFQGMMNANDSQNGLQYMGNDKYYNESVVVIMKGEYMELTRILTTFTTIDLSNNMLEGEIPKVTGELSSLKGLNLSHNRIIGNIPQSLSNLRNLEWLDLSRNRLTGVIPVALTNLNFLSFLNLSQNQFEGIIPASKQFDTFGNESYEGNPMLCGFPLSKSCDNDGEKQLHSTFDDEEESGFGWKAVVVGYACGTVFGMLLGYNVLFLTGKPQWLARLVESTFNIRVKRANNRANANRRGMN